MIDVNVHWFAPIGWRLMDMSLKSNQPVPVRNQMVNIELYNGPTLLTGAFKTTDANGVASVTNNMSADRVKVTDRFGNTTTFPFPL